MAGRGHEPIALLPPWLIAGTTAALGAVFWALVDWLAPTQAQWALPARTTLLVLSGAALLFLVLGLLYLRLWLGSRTRVAFGVLWDVRNQPICPKCHGPLTKNDGTSWLCGACRACLSCMTKLHQQDIFTFGILLA